MLRLGCDYTLDHIAFNQLYTAKRNPMIQVLFFAQVRELLGTAKLAFSAEDITTTESLRAALAAQDDKWAKVMASDKLLVAVNQTMSHWDTEVADGDEVAFFPPVTGG